MSSTSPSGRPHHDPRAASSPRARSASRRRRGSGGRRRSSGRCSGRGARRRPARTRTGRRSGGSAWRRRRAGAPAGLARVLDPEVGDAGPPGEVRSRPEVGDQRVVGVQARTRSGRRAGDQLGPVVGEVLQLAVAVELVAKQVAEHDQAWLEVRRDPGQPRLVDLEQPLVARPARAARWRRPSSCSSRRGCGRRLRPARPQRRGDHPRGGGLAVGRADDRRAVPTGDAPSREIASGAIRSSSRPGRVVPPPRPLRRLSAPAARASASLGPNRTAHPGRPAGRSRRSARGSTRMIAGRSARWSPSA